MFKDSKTVADLKEAINKCDKLKMYSSALNGSWGIYVEFRGKPLEKSTASNRGYGNHDYVPVEVFNRKFDIGTSKRFAAQIGEEKFAYMTGTAGCREFIQDELWTLIQPIKDKIDLKCHIKASSPDIFRETSAYTKKSYKGRKGYSVLNGGLYSSIAENTFTKAGGEEGIAKQVKMLDLLIGIPFTLLDRYPDSINKKKYAKKGIAGRFILDKAKSYSGTPMHYFLYLVPGNVLVKAPWVPSLAIGMMRYIYGNSFNGNEPVLDYLAKLANPRDVRNAINNGDFKLASKIFHKIKPILATGPIGDRFYAFSMNKQDRIHCDSGYNAESYGANANAAGELYKHYIPLMMMEYIIARGGFPFMSDGLEKDWNLHVNPMSLQTHGNTAVGWSIASFLTCAKHIDDFKKFAKNYDATKKNF
jgi:hypothetical protein